MGKDGVGWGQMGRGGVTSSLHSMDRAMYLGWRKKQITRDRIQRNRTKISNFCRVNSEEQIAPDEFA